MSIQRFEPNARMSEAVVHGNTVYLAGQIGNEGQDITEQTRTALAEVDRALALAGTNKSNILQATIWLSDMKDFAAMNAVWDAWIDPQNPPARATGKVELANPKLGVEIVVIAALPQ
ncbi:RidA family protein [Alcaligenaceae bacterium 429]|uniref:RidA family protein n=1 Tax=unclassified Paenalcaligenes TaxID=2685726 RepID=UPI0010930649|nr:RidA family protein [Alcaligenaceae bacterium 429]